MTIWTAGFGVPDLAARSGLSTDALGRLLTDETLTSVDDARIVAAGDSAAPSDLPLRMSCQAAMPLGAQAADTVLSRIAGERPAPIDHGVRRPVHQPGAPRRHLPVRPPGRHGDGWFHLGGRTGAKLKEVVCKGTVKQLADEARRARLARPPVSEAPGAGSCCAPSAGRGRRPTAARRSR